MLNTIKIIAWEWNYGPVDEGWPSTWSLVISTENGKICAVDAFLPTWLSYPEDNTKSGYIKMQDYVVWKNWKWSFSLGINLNTNNIASYEGFEKNGIVWETTDSNDYIYWDLVVESIFSRVDALNLEKKYYALYDNLELNLYNNTLERDEEFRELLDRLVDSKNRCIIHQIELWFDSSLISVDSTEEYHYKYALIIYGINLERIE